MGSPMVRTNLKRRGHTYYVRVAVPPELRRVVGAEEVLRTLKTRDLAEANRRKHAAIATLQAEWAQLQGQPQSNPRSASAILQEARELLGAIRAGTITADQAEAALDATVDGFTEQHDVDAEGDPEVPEGDAEAIRTAYRVLTTDGAVHLLSETAETYLTEKSRSITKAGRETKRRHIDGFAKWLQVDVEVRTIDKARAGRYVTEKLAPSGLSVKTITDAIDNLSSFWNWMEGRGYVDVNVWKGKAATVRASTRGGVTAKRRPWTDAELLKLLKGTKDDPRLYPLVALGAYTGMRLEELAQLKVEDFDGSALSVREGKTASAVRRVPVHPVIANLVKRLASTSTDGYLVSDLKPGGIDGRRSHYASRRFGAAKVRLGFTDKGLVFHTLRNAFMQRCEDAEVPESTTKLIVGHSRGSDITYGVYSPGPKFEKLAAAVARVTYGEADGYVRSSAGIDGRWGS
jgi:integrase